MEISVSREGGVMLRAPGLAKKRVRLLWAGLLLAILQVTSVRGFSLLGPYASWMVYSNGYQWAGDIGGPMDISQGYRWNVPIVTYGFDLSFLDYFGSNGVAAVESAIQVMNDLPPASQLQITNYALATHRRNFGAEAEGLVDLKSATLVSLVEQMGLASPSRYMFALRRWSPSLTNDPYSLGWWDWAIPDYVMLRNFDPVTLRASSYINQVLYAPNILDFPAGRHWIQVLPVDSLADSYNAVADGFGSPYDPFGEVLTGLTQDDVGGLKYLLSPSNFAYEELLADVHGVGASASNYVRGGWRVGVDKITFVRQAVNGLNGQFLPTTNQFTDAYLSNWILVQQSVERVTTQPDFLFSAIDEPEVAQTAMERAVKRSGTENWTNNAASNSQPGEPGPGVIQPQVRISFQKLGPNVATQESGSGITIWHAPMSWGSFDVSTNAPIAYPGADASVARLGTKVRLVLHGGSNGGTGTFVWSLPLTNGQSAVLQSSTNLIDWATCAVITNLGAVTEWDHYGASQAQRYFAVRAQ